MNYQRRQSGLETKNEIAPVAPVIDRFGPISDADDKRLAVLARVAKEGKYAYRNTLFAVFEPRLHRTAARMWQRSGQHRGVELDDLKQESFVIFAQLVTDWDGERSFARFILGVFPWRMHSAILRLGDSPISDELLHSSLAADAESNYQSELALELIDELAESMSFWQQKLFYLRARNGFSERQAVKAMGLSRRTVQRLWIEVQAQVKDELFGDEAE